MSLVTARVPRAGEDPSDVGTRPLPGAERESEDGGDVLPLVERSLDLGRVALLTPRRHRRDRQGAPRRVGQESERLIAGVLTETPQQVLLLAG